MLDRLPLPQSDLDREMMNFNWEEEDTGREKILGILRPDLDRTRATGPPVPQPVEPVGHNLDRLSLLALKTYLFQFLSFLTLRQGLYVNYYVNFKTFCLSYI